ncbi:hypothetical protein QCN29_21085 [Streptomyces sp. HNM0663]|uniref:Uncharacterized protein n=1 Tax=Streptomyces chengmaiensis TaxID=3040919 RepID=A0ABT6HSD3_9ACTN|nr:hypothetical protein [Streptomyces chengmaiensis]MDH2391232.1 hypothetical protein [Streptomyces chengmaiensis]
MAGRGDPPEGTPDGTPEEPHGGNEDEFRSVVFDESFVRAARLQEFSAQERMGEHAQAVRSLPAWSGRTARTQILVILLLVAIAFGTAVYLGLRQPYQPAPVTAAEPLRMSVIPLAPQGPVPGGTPEELYGNGPAAEYRVGAAGVTLPAARRTADFSEGQVMTALTTAKEYIVESTLNPEVLSGAAVRPVRALLDPDQFEQFDRSVETPAADGAHSATGWLVRYDPAEVELADPEVRVQGTLRYGQRGQDSLEVVSDHTFAFVLRPADKSASDQASLFTVRRELHFRFDRDDLHHRRAEVTASTVMAGPQSCSADLSDVLRPLLAGERASQEGPAVTDPYEHGPVTAGLCGTLSPTARPSP